MSLSKKDIDVLEKMQKRATQLMVYDKSLSYHEILAKLGLKTLENGRLHSNLTEVFKSLKDLYLLPT